MIRIQPLPLAGAVLAAALTAACSPSTATPPADPTAAPSFGATDLPAGSHVQVARAGQWFAATVLQAAGNGQYKIHYDNYASEYDEVVGPDRIKTPSPGALGALGSLLGTGPTNDFKPGEKVLVTYQGRLLLAEVIMQTGADQWRVHYDGWGPEAAETAGVDRIKRPFAGPSGHAAGEALLVDVGGQPLPAKVIAVSAADRWLVRFDGYGPQYDQEVGVDRIRAAVPAVAPPPPAPEADKTKDKDKGKPKAPPPDPAPQSGPPAVGETVMVHLRNAYFPAVVGAGGAGSVIKVKFPNGTEEDVAAERVLRGPASVKGLKYKAGQAVVVSYKGMFLAATVVKSVGKNDYKVHFDGLGPEDDETVDGKRLRPR